MTVNHQPTLIMPLTFMLLLLLAACTDSEQLKNKHLDNAKSYIQQANYNKARIELKNVLQIDPKTAQAYYLLGQTEEKRNEMRSALANYMKAIELDPNIIDAQIRLAQYYLTLANQYKNQNNTPLEEKNLQIAKDKITYILSKKPNSINARTLQASLLASQGNINESILMLNSIIKDQADSYSAILLLSRLYKEQKNLSSAIDVLNSGINNLPDNILLMRELSNIYVESGQLDKAIEISETIVEKKPGSLSHMATLAYYYEQKKQPHKTEKLIRHYIKNNPDEIKAHIMLTQFLEKRNGIDYAIEELIDRLNRNQNLTDLHFNLASLYSKKADYDNAIKTLEIITKSLKLSPEYIKSHKIIAEIHIINNKLEKAKYHINLLLEENPNDGDALILKARVAFIENDYPTSITSLRSVLKSRPDSIDLLRLLSDAYIKSNQIELAEEVLKKISYLQPKSIKSQLDIARFNIASNQLEQALSQIEITLTEFPDNFHALKLKTEIFLAQGNVKDAIPVINTIKLIYPNDAEGWFRMARIYKLTDKLDLAIKELEVAVEKSPDSHSLLAELIDLEIASGKSSNAKSRLQKILNANKNHPSAHKFIAMIYMSENEPIKAKAEFELQLKLHPDDPVSYLQLAKIEISNNHIADAINYYNMGIQRLPNNQQLISELASTYENTNQYDKAISLYKKILSSNPDNIIAANNLAMILVSRKADKESYAYAANIVENFKSSNQSVLLDTYAWVNYHNGNYPQAVKALNQAILLTPEIPVLYYHLAMNYKELNNIELATNNLETALSKGNFPGMNKAKLTLESIKNTAH